MIIPLAKEVNSAISDTKLDALTSCGEIQVDAVILDGLTAST